MCSDGLYNWVSEEDIYETCADESARVRELVNYALKNGGNDNITAIKINIEHRGIIARIFNGQRG